MYRCRIASCRAVNEYYMGFCPACGEEGVMVPINAVVPERNRQVGKRLVTKAKDHSMEKIPRMKTGIDNLDIMYGGEEDPGIPEGFVIQLVGPPGIGKSTLVTQIAGGPLCNETLYVAGEEAASRVGRRAKRLRCKNAEEIQIIHTQDLPTVFRAMREVNAKLVIIDSLQGLRLHSPEIPDDEQDEDGLIVNLPKHTQQTVRDVAFQLIREATRNKRTIILLAHINKDNTAAGLREIEHMVDAVSYFDGNPRKRARQGWCTKDREADVTYTAHFKMTDTGLVSYDPKLEKVDEEEEDDEEGKGKGGPGEGEAGGAAAPHAARGGRRRRGRDAAADS